MALALLIITLTLQVYQCGSCSDKERTSLLRIKASVALLHDTGNPQVLPSWTDDPKFSDCCLWERVNCSITSGHVVELSLDGVMNETGQILNLSLLRSFENLQSLVLSRNGFGGLFDQFEGLIMNLTKLQKLDLSYNRFTGFGHGRGLANPGNLQVLNLRGNQLISAPEGEIIPTHSLPRFLVLSCKLSGYLDICGLTHLRELDLSSNALTGLPYCFGNLSRLRTLDLSHNELSGDLSSFVSALPPLEYLSLLDNNFEGPFSFDSLVNQSSLEVFRLSSRVGRIQLVHPESSWTPYFQLKILQLWNCTFEDSMLRFVIHQHELRAIDLSHNQLVGSFPDWLLKNNTMLQMVLLNGNSLEKLLLPDLVHGLQVLDISNNRISGSVPEDIGIVLPNLTYMNFSNNQFQGRIPSSFGEMKSLRLLDMSSNSLSGQLPKPFLTGCSSLLLLKLSHNQLQGKVFPGYSNLTDLVALLLEGNNFSGSIGKGLSNSVKLQHIDISDNMLSNELPHWISRLLRLLFLRLRGNRIQGPFPHQLQELTRLQEVDISDNNLSGSLPWNLNISSLRELKLQNNGLEGHIPDSLFESRVLKVIDLRNNKLSGNILNSIGKISPLRVLLLRNNRLRGHIPEKICHLSKVNLLDLSHNKFRGFMPSCIGNMSFGMHGYEDSNEMGVCIDFISLNIGFWEYFHYSSDLVLEDTLETNHIVEPPILAEFLAKRRYESFQGEIVSDMFGLDLSSNALSGSIPVQVGDLQKIHFLDLSRNRFTGSIPESVAKLKNIESLDLSNNNLTGNIPTQLSGLNNLGYFNVSYNNLSGQIPFKDHLTTFDEQSYIGNEDLCGPPKNKSCVPLGVQESEREEDENYEDDDEGDVIIDMEWFYWSFSATYVSILVGHANGFIVSIFSLIISSGAGS
uniref:Leucine-rich repeat-containing N-terminal plant-type domain-containing protein n=1 Tax=Tarenaya spinosa TaxID=228870 RepID=B2BXR6_9ROSI|nr:unknown [Tarenaya spinosa]